MESTGWEPPGKAGGSTSQNPHPYYSCSAQVQVCTGLHQLTGGPILRTECQEGMDQTLRDASHSPRPAWGRVCMAGVLTPPPIRLGDPARDASSSPCFIGTKASAEVREFLTAQDGSEDESPKRNPTQSKVVLVVKNPPVNAGDIRDLDSIPGSRRSPGGGHGNPLQCSCLENPMDKGACQAIVHRVAKSQT